MSPQSNPFCTGSFYTCQMSMETEDDFYQSEEDLDEDEATQYIIEQSLIQYRKLKGLNPRFLSTHPAFTYKYLYYECLVCLSESLFCAITLNSDLKPCEDPDEIFKAIKEGKLMTFNLSADSDNSESFSKI